MSSPRTPPSPDPVIWENEHHDTRLLHCHPSGTDRNTEYMIVQATDERLSSQIIFLTKDEARQLIIALKQELLRRIHDRR